MTALIAKRILVSVAIGDFKSDSASGAAYTAVVLEDGGIYILGNDIQGGTVLWPGQVNGLRAEVEKVTFPQDHPAYRVEIFKGSEKIGDFNVSG